MIGLRAFYKVAADIAFTSNVVLTTIGLKSPIAANSDQNFRAWIPFTLGAAGGFKCEVLVPAAGVSYRVSITYFDALTPAVDTTTQTAAAAFGAALANAGNYFALIDGYVSNGANAGNIDIQVCQNSSNADTMTVLKGGYLDVIKS